MSTKEKPQHRFHLVDAHRAAVAAHFVHHVQRQNHGDIQLHQLHGQVEVALNIVDATNIERNLYLTIQLHQLHGQVEVALDVGGVHDIDDAGGLFADDELAGDDLLAGIGGTWSRCPAGR